MGGDTTVNAERNQHAVEEGMDARAGVVDRVGQGQPVEQSKDTRRVPCIVMTRVVGYISIVSQWNKGKKQEFKDRKLYAIPTTERLAALDPALLPRMPRGDGPGQ